MDIKAKTYHLKLASAQDALEVVSCIRENALLGLVFEIDDISSDFFNFSNGMAGEILQKLVNYRAKIAIILPQNHGFGKRVDELALEHKSHANIRFFPNTQEGVDWINE